MKLDRRRFVGSSVGVAAAAGVTAEWVWPKHTVSYRRPRSAVAVLNAAEYSERIEALLLDGLRLFRLQVLGRSILLKPNLVEDLPGSVNTNSTLIGAAARCFLRLGAARVVIGEGPGHQRDTERGVREPNGMRESGSRKKDAAVPYQPMSCFLLRQSRPEGRRKSGSLKKTCSDSRRSDLLAFLGNRSQREGTRKSGSLEKSDAIPLRTRLPWLPLGERARPDGMRKSGSFENRTSDRA